ncbi:hypothetical protein AWR27_06560 [Spirosoma montaniterrae]|uniref:histidine kinase n=1 Tax=Spirosoma montaniterrae TaxID=1178516 RepID=A0A1P9WUF1_9BACT|nr:hypothetical protein AWR27_06560 [Spirosoma montaniterrae]
MIAYEAVRQENTGNASNPIIDYRTLYVNPQLIAITGYSTEELYQRMLFERAPYARVQASQFRELTEEGKPFDFLYFNERSGRWLNVQNRSLTGGFFATFQDVTDLEEAKSQLKDQAVRLQQQAEQATQQQTLLKSVLDTSPSSITVERAVRDETGQIIDFQATLINAAALQLGGHSEEAALTKRISELNPNFKSSGLLDAYCRVLESGYPLHLDVFYPPANKHLELLATRMDSDHIVVLFNDITQAKQYADDLRQKNTLLDGILRTSDSSIVVYEAVKNDLGQVQNFQIILANDAATRMSGRSREEVIGRLLTDLYPVTQVDGMWNQYMQVYNTGEIFRGEHYYNSVDRWFDVTINKLGDGLVATFNETTQIKWVRQQVEEQARLFDSVLENMTNGLTILEAIRDQNGEVADLRYVRASRSVLQDTGLTEAQTLSSTVLALFPSVKETDYWRAYQETLRTGVPQRFEVHYKGEGLDNYTDNWITRLDENRIISVYSIINEQKNALQRTEQLVADLQRSNASLEQFAYVASHDLQEPLRKIQSFGAILIDQYSHSLSEDGVDILRRMQSAANRMSLLTRDLLTFSRLASQQEPFQPVDLQVLVTEVLTDLEITIQEKKARVIIGADSPLPTLAGNVFQLRQLFQNLISNALKFSKPGLPPQVTVSTRIVEASYVPIPPHSRANKTWATIAISDNGIGFAPEFQERIFQLFERLHGRSEYAGTGIGLAICRKVAENHGGTITAQSQPGQGATFTVYLPLGVVGL